MNITENTKIDAVRDVILHGFPKAVVARERNVSPRTIGRWVDKYGHVFDDLDDLPEVDEESEEVIEDSDSDVTYHVVADSFSVSIMKVVDDSLASTETITKGHKDFDEISGIVWDGRGSQDSLKKAFSKISLAQKVIDSVENGNVHIDMDRGRVSVTLDGYEISLSGLLSERIISAAEEGRSLDHLCRFTEKLYQNPSDSAVREAYQFIEAMDIEINDEGNLLCFKRVRGDYTDCYSGTFDNTPGGDPVWVPRNQVDEDSSRTCSKGLHVASKAYLPYYFGERVVMCEVNPKDIVSVPEDYYGIDEGGHVKAKMRVCEYRVMADVTEEIFSWMVTR